MINADVLIAAEQRRLAWRCRRGMLELDIILQRFIETKFKALTLDELTTLDGLLDLPDGQFLAIVQSETPHEDPRVSQLVALMNGEPVGKEVKERQ